MSRSGYTEDIDDVLAYGRWRAAVLSATRGRRGQVLLKQLVDALDEMPDKRLYPGSFATAEGEFCALGALAAARGIKTDDLGDEEDCDPREVGDRFDIARALAAEIMFMNDEAISCIRAVTVEICGPMRPHWPDRGRHGRTVIVPDPEHPQKRWRAMRAWAERHLADSKDATP